MNSVRLNGAAKSLSMSHLCVDDPCNNYVYTPLYELNASWNECMWLPEEMIPVQNDCIVTE